MGRSTYDFKGENALITGASKGIGKATALQLAKAGCNVFIADFDDKNGPTTAEEIKALGVKCAYRNTDVRNYDDVKAMTDEAIALLGEINIVICCAGVTSFNPGDPFTDIPLEEFHHQFSINTFGALHVIYALYDHLVNVSSKKYGFAKIVNISSIAALMHSPIATPYAMAKISLIEMSKALSKELGKHKINVNVVNPGYVYTYMYEGDAPDDKHSSAMAIRKRKMDQLGSFTTPESVVNAMASVSALGRRQETDDIAHAIVFLVSEDASEITGQVINVDSGIII